MNPAERFGAALAGASGPGLELRFWWVANVNAGPPKSLDLALTRADALAGIANATVEARYSASYAVLVPAQGDGVFVLGTVGGGGSTRAGQTQGGWYFVVDKVAF